MRAIKWLFEFIFSMMMAVSFLGSVALLMAFLITAKCCFLIGMAVLFVIFLILLIFGEIFHIGGMGSY